MKSRSLVVSVSAVAVGVLGLSACSSEKPSGLAPFTPTARSSSPSPSPTISSKWTPQQQRVIDGYQQYNELVTRILSKAEKIDLAKAHQVAKEPYATKFLQGIDGTLSAGFVRTGKVAYTFSAVTVVGDSATIKTCLDLTPTKFFKPGSPSAAPLQNPPPSRATVSLAREGGSWLVSGLKDGEGTCVTG